MRTSTRTNSYRCSMKDVVMLKAARPLPKSHSVPSLSTAWTAVSRGLFCRLIGVLLKLVVLCYWQAVQPLLDPCGPAAKDKGEALHAKEDGNKAFRTAGFAEAVDRYTKVSFSHSIKYPVDEYAWVIPCELLRVGAEHTTYDYAGDIAWARSQVSA